MVVIFSKQIFPNISKYFFKVCFAQDGYMWPVHIKHLYSELYKTYQAFVPSTRRRRYQWWVKTNPYLSLRTLLLPLSPRQTWLHLAHRTTARPTRSTPYPHSRSGSTSRCGSTSRENMSTWMDPGTTWQPLPVSYVLKWEATLSLLDTCSSLQLLL